MTKRISILLISILLVSMAFPAVAGSNDAVKECTKEQLVEVATTITDAGFTDQYKTVSNELTLVNADNAVSVLPGIIENLSKLQES